MAPTLTPETDVESLVGDVDAESLRTSERHRADLERWAKGIAGQDLTLDFTTENGETARVDYSQSPPHVTIPGWEIPQPVTDLDRPAYDILMQQALTLHEVGHVLYTDEDVASEATADVSPKHRGQFQRFWNALEDGAIEEQLRRDYDVTEELGVMNANFLGRPEGEFGIMDAVLASCLDLGVYDTGTLRRLADPDDEAVRFSSEDDRELFADEIFDELVETVGAVRTEPDPISRVEAAYEGWQAIEEHIDAADDTSGDQVSFNDGHPCPADGAAGATAEMAQTAQQGMEDRIEEFLDSVDGIDAETDSIADESGSTGDATSDDDASADDGASADGEAATGSEPEASQKPTDDTQGSETDRETADADTGEDASSRESSDDAGSGARQTAESSAGDGTDPESTEAADDADAGGETAEGVTSTADSTGHDQDDVGKDAPAENERDQHTDEPPTDAEQTSETSQTDAEQTDDEQQEGAVGSSEASSDSEGSHDGVTESSDADTPESEADVGSSEEADETADGTGADGPSEKEATGEATDTPETRDADERTDTRDSTAGATDASTAAQQDTTAGEDDATEAASDRSTPAGTDTEDGTEGAEAEATDAASQDDSTGERPPDSGESSSAPGDGQSPGETEAEAPQKGAGGGELELPDRADDSAGSAGTEPDQRNTDSEVEDDVWTDDLDTDPEVPPEVADEYQSRAEEQLEQQERAADRRAEELESLQETLDEIDDVYVDDLRIVEGPVDGTYRSSEVSDIRQESRRLSNILQRQLQQEQRSEYRHDQRQGDLDTRVTHRLQLYDFRVFRQEISPDEKDYDVVFVLDRSGSMGSDIYAAERATATLAMALETVEVDTCIIDMYDYEPRVAKPFGTDIEDSLRAILTGDYTGGTPLSPCLELARNHLRKRSSHPFMIVVTDGRPRNEERYSDLLKRTKFPVLGVYLDFLASGPNDVPQHVRDAGHLFNRRRIITAEEELLPGLRQLCQNVMF